jgi:hypothetical protein
MIQTLHMGTSTGHMTTTQSVTRIGLAGLLGALACGPQVQVDDETGGDGSSTGAQTTTTGVSTVLPSTTGETSASPDDSVDGDVTTDCRGECGVECFSDRECGPGGYCTDSNQCGRLPELLPCRPENLHAGATQIIGGVATDVEVAALWPGGPTYLVVALDGPPRVLAFPAGMGQVAETPIVGLDTPRAISIGDANGDGVQDVFVATEFGIARVPADPMMGLLPAQLVEMTMEPIDGFAAGYGNDDGTLDLVLFQHTPEPATSLLQGSGMGMFFGGFPTPLAPPNDLAERVAIASEASTGIAIAIAAGGDIRRLHNTFDGAFLEGNRMPITNSFSNTPVVDVSVHLSSSGFERTAGIVNIDGYTMVGVATFDNGVAGEVDRWSLAEPSRRIEIGEFGAFDYLLGTESGKTLVVRGDCYDEHLLRAPANAFAVGDVTDNGADDVVVATDDGVFLMPAAG